MSTWYVYVVHIGASTVYVTIVLAIDVYNTIDNNYNVFVIIIIYGNTIVCEKLQILEGT